MYLKSLLLTEYLHNGCATEKSDVYSFGVLLLELVTGKRPTDSSFVNRGLNIVGWVTIYSPFFFFIGFCFFCSDINLSSLCWQMNTMAGDNRLEEIVDEKCGNVDAEAVEIILDIAAMCTDANPDDRPTMSSVLLMLEEEIMSPCSSHFYESHLDI